MDLGVVRPAIFTACGAAGSAITALFGGWSADFDTLLILMTTDYIMGIILAGYFKKSGKSKTGALSSTAGWLGLCKKGASLLLVLLAHRLDVSLGLDFTRTMVIVALILNEAVSIIENAGLMGVPIPEQLAKAIEVLRAKH